MDRLVVGLAAAAVISVVLPWLLERVTTAELVVVVLLVGAGLLGRHLRRSDG